LLKKCSPCFAYSESWERRFLNSYERYILSTERTKVLVTRHSIPPNAETGRRVLKVTRAQNWLVTRGISGHHLTIEECDAKLLCRWQ
jgi:hypothetical protein